VIGSSSHARGFATAAAICLILALLGACSNPRPAAPAAPAVPAAPQSGGTQGSGSQASAPAATPAPVKMTTAYTTASASMAPVWMADETGAFKEFGIDAEVTFIGAGQAILGALTTQEAPLVLAGANQAIEANLQGGEYVILGTAMPYLTNSIYVVPSIEKPEDLKGKSIGVSNFGAISHVALKVALDHWKLEEGRDVTVIRSGGTPETLASMQTGAIHGGSFSPPQTFRARDLGFRELIDISNLKWESGSSAILSTRAYVAQHPDVVERYLKALIKGVHAFKTDRELGIDATMRYSRLDDLKVGEETWLYYKDKMSDDLVTSRSAIDNNLKFIAEEKPQARSARPEQFLDTTFVDRIKASGFVDQVKRGQ
jgi:NitT/TauT family transport system substrate-binding protein